MSRSISMLLHSLSQHWPARKLEWLMAGLASTWGIYVLSHPDLFTNRATAQSFAGLAVMTAWTGLNPAVVWGGSSFCMGIMRAMALFVNGAYARTPVLRALAAFGSMFIFTQVSIGFARSGVPNPELVVYPWLVIADLLSAYRAAQDAVYAEVQRQTQKDNQGAAVHLVAS